MLTRYITINGQRVATEETDWGWPVTSERCPVDDTRLLWTVHGDLFYCGNEEDEHLFLPTYGL